MLKFGWSIRISWNIFLEIVEQKGLFDEIKENPKLRQMLHIYRQTLLNEKRLISFVKNTHLINDILFTLPYADGIISFPVISRDCNLVRKKICKLNALNV